MCYRAPNRRPVQRQRGDGQPSQVARVEYSPEYRNEPAGNSIKIVGAVRQPGRPSAEAADDYPRAKVGGGDVRGWARRGLQSRRWPSFGSRMRAREEVTQQARRFVDRRRAPPGIASSLVPPPRDEEIRRVSPGTATRLRSSGSPMRLTCDRLAVPSAWRCHARSSAHPDTAAAFVSGRVCS